MSEPNTEAPQAQSVDPAIAYRIAMARINALMEELVLCQASLHEARTNNLRLEKELRDTYEATNAEINKLATESQQLRLQLEEFMTDDHGSDDNEVSAEAPRINGKAIQS